MFRFLNLGTSKRPLTKIKDLKISLNQRSSYAFRYHMKRCVESGLWVPSKEDPATNTEDGFTKKDGDKESEGDGEDGSSEKEGEKEEEIYEEVK